MTWGINQNIIDFYCPAHYEHDFPCLQLQLTQRLPVPQDPVSIIVPIVYDMATGLTQQADIPRQHSSSGAAALMVSNILKRFNELHPARQGEPCTPRRFTVQIQVHLLIPAILSFLFRWMYDICFCSWADGQPQFAPLHSSVDGSSSELVPDLWYRLLLCPRIQSILHLIKKKKMSFWRCSQDVKSTYTAIRHCK